MNSLLICLSNLLHIFHVQLASQTYTIPNSTAPPNSRTARTITLNTCGTGRYLHRTVYIFSWLVLYANFLVSQTVHIETKAKDQSAAS